MLEEISDGLFEHVGITCAEFSNAKKAANGSIPRRLWIFARSSAMILTATKKINLERQLHRARHWLELILRLLMPWMQCDGSVHLAYCPEEMPCADHVCFDCNMCYSELWSWFFWWCLWRQKIAFLLLISCESFEHLTLYVRSQHTRSLERVGWFELQWFFHTFASHMTLLITWQLNHFIKWGKDWVPWGLSDQGLEPWGLSRGTKLNCIIRPGIVMFWGTRLSRIGSFQGGSESWCVTHDAILKLAIGPF